MICERCSNDHDGSFGSGRFCSRTCSNSRTRTDDVKERVSRALRGRITGKAFVGQNTCSVCGNEFAVTCKTKANKCCSALCVNTARKQKGRINGLKSASVTHRRSKNEILFATLCEQEFGSVITNEPIFDGWDADVILPHLAVAVLWNGPWHYVKLTKKHSLEQVQNRDRIKLQKIDQANYRAYVIRDDGSYNQKFVYEQFEIFKTWIGEIGIPRRS